jgi:hypothetical protein
VKTKFHFTWHSSQIYKRLYATALLISGLQLHINKNRVSPAFVLNFCILYFLKAISYKLPYGNTSIQFPPPPPQALLSHIVVVSTQGTLLLIQSCLLGNGSPEQALVSVLLQTALCVVIVVLQLVELHTVPVGFRLQL